MVGSFVRGSHVLAACLVLLVSLVVFRSLAVFCFCPFEVGWLLGPVFLLGRCFRLVSGGSWARGPRGAGPRGGLRLGAGLRAAPGEGCGGQGGALRGGRGFGGGWWVVGVEAGAGALGWGGQVMSSDVK